MKPGGAGLPKRAEGYTQGDKEEIMEDAIKSKFVQHVRKYRPDSVTSRLANEVERLRKKVGICEECGEEFTIQDAFCAPCFNEWCAKKFPEAGLKS